MKVSRYYKKTFKKRYGLENVMVSYELLRAKLAADNIKKKDLMKRTGISVATMSKIKNDKYVSLEVIERICKDLNCNIGDIIRFKS